jgi:diaminopimelate epimerase
MAYDGKHEALFSNDWIEILMADVQNVRVSDLGTFIDTGSPHLINYVEDVDSVDVYSEGRKLRHSDINGDAGTNVNFVQKVDESTISVRTYERGVENETLSCGTGVTAAAISTGISPVQIRTKGGRLEVSFSNKNGTYTDIYLKGPAESVFKGTIAI